METKMHKKSRVQQINESISQNIKTIYRLRKIQCCMIDSRENCAYAVSFAKTAGITLEEQAVAFYSHLSQILRSGESVAEEGKCVCVYGEDFALTYCLEAWRKTADKRVYIRDGVAVTEPLGRMSCEQAAAIFNKNETDVLALINTLDILQQISDPADKYVELTKFPLLLKKR